MVKHSGLIICVKAIYFSLSSSSFFVLIVAAKWKMYDFFKLATDSCSRTFLTKGKDRRRLKGMLIASLLIKVWLLGLRASFETVQVRTALLILVALDRVPQKTLSEASTGQVSFAVGVAFKWNLYSSAAAWPISHTKHWSSSGRAILAMHTVNAALHPAADVLTWLQPSSPIMALPRHSRAVSDPGYPHQPWFWAPPAGRCPNQASSYPNPFPRILSGYPRTVSGPGYFQTCQILNTNSFFMVPECRAIKA